MDDTHSLLQMRLGLGLIQQILLYKVRDWVRLFRCFLSSYTGPPLLFRAPQSHIRLENTSVIFFCLAFAQPFPVVSWTYMNREITPSEKYSIGSSGTLFGSLTIRNIKFEDTGLYTCNYTNEHGSIIRSAMLTVQGIHYYYN